MNTAYGSKRAGSFQMSRQPSFGSKRGKDYGDLHPDDHHALAPLTRGEEVMRLEGAHAQPARANAR